MFHGFMLLVVEAHNESLCILLLGQDKSSQEVLRVFTASLDLFRGGWVSTIHGSYRWGNDPI